MKAIFIIIIACMILYKAGTIRKILNIVTIKEPATAPMPAKKTLELSDREKLEIDARYIIARQGQNPETVKYMSDGLLQAIITDFKNDIRKGGQI